MYYPVVEQPRACSEFSLRPMSAADLAAVTRIEKASSPCPWNHNLFSGCLGSSYVCVVAADARSSHPDAPSAGAGTNGIMGFGIASGAGVEGRIVNLAVHPQYRSLGCGRKMLEFLIERLREMPVERILLEVRASNQEAIRLYKRSGFRRIGVCKDYYSLGEGRENAVLMERTLFAKIHRARVER